MVQCETYLVPLNKPKATQSSTIWPSTGAKNRVYSNTTYMYVTFHCWKNFHSSMKLDMCIQYWYIFLTRCWKKLGSRYLLNLWEKGVRVCLQVTWGGQTGRYIVHIHTFIKHNQYYCSVAQIRPPFCNLSLSTYVGCDNFSRNYALPSGKAWSHCRWGVGAKHEAERCSDASGRLTSFSVEGWGSRAVPRSSWRVHRWCRWSVFAVDTLTIDSRVA